MSDDDKAVIDGDEAVDMEDGTVVQGDDRVVAEKDDNKESESSTDQSTETSREDAKTPEESKSTPFHEHPRFKEIARQNREYREQIGKLESQHKELMEKVQSQPNVPQNQLSQEQQAAAQQLRDILFPGLNPVEQIQQMQEQLKQINQQKTDEAFDAEEKRLLGKIKEYGLAKDSSECDEILNKLENHIDESPILSKIKSQPGVWEIAFNNMFFNKVTEMGERTANRKLIENQEKAKATMSESSNSSESGKIDVKTTGDAVRDYVNLVQKLGGDQAIDMTA